MAAQLPRSTNRTAPAPNAPKATPERMKAILEALRKKQKNKLINKKKARKTGTFYSYKQRTRKYHALRIGLICLVLNSNSKLRDFK